MTFRALLALGLLVFAPAMAADKSFSPDTNHTVIGFTASTLLFDVTGHFDRYQVKIKGDPEMPATVEIRVEIDPKSVNTANKTRDGHLRGDDFLDIASFPKIVFTSSKAWRQGSQLIVQGQLALHGKTKDLQIAFDEAAGLNGAGSPTWSYKGSLPINRQEFGVGAASVAAKISLKDEVRLNLLLVGFFEDPQPEVEKKAPTKSKASSKTK